MNLRKTFALSVVGLAALIVTAGCTSQQKQKPKPLVAQSQPAPAPRKPAPRVDGWPMHRSGGAVIWSSMAYPTGDAKTSAIGIEKGLPSEVRLNQPFDYELVVTNLTDLTLQDVVVREDLGDNFKLTSSAPRGQVGSDGLANWSIGSLEPGQSKTIRVNGTASAEGSVCSCASVSYTSLLCACVPVVQPKLRLTKSGPAEVLKCDEIVYRFEVANTGSGSVQNVRISDPLPSGLLTSEGRNTITFDAGTLAPGKSKAFTAKVEAQRTGRFENKATASGEGGLSATSAVVTTVVRQPVLKIEKTCPGKQFIGRPLNYAITVTNTGDGVARETVLEDAVPSGATFVSATDGGRLVGNTVRWTIGTLQPKASKRVTLRVDPAGAGIYRNTATAKAYCAAPVSDSCQSEVTGIPAILLEVIDVEDPIEVGNNETYIITVTNQGSAPGTNITINCTLENNQQYVSSSGATRATARGNQVNFAPLASLAAKEKATFRVVVKNVAVGDVRFKVTMTSDQLRRPVEETEATNIYE